MRASLAHKLESRASESLHQLVSRYNRETRTHPARRWGAGRSTSMGTIAGEGSISLRSSPS